MCRSSLHLFVNLLCVYFLIQKISELLKLRKEDNKSIYAKIALEILNPDKIINSYPDEKNTIHISTENVKVFILSHWYTYIYERTLYFSPGQWLLIQNISNLKIN